MEGGLINNGWCAGVISHSNGRLGGVGYMGGGWYACTIISVPIYSCED